MINIRSVTSSVDAVYPVEPNLEHGTDNHIDIECVNINGDLKNTLSLYFKSNICIDYENNIFCLGTSNDWDDIVDTSKCVFCDRRLRKVKGHNQVIRKSSLESKTQTILKVLGLTKMQEKADQLQTASSISYHSA